MDLRRRAGPRGRPPATWPSWSGRPSPTGASTSGSSTSCAPRGSSPGARSTSCAAPACARVAAAEALTDAGLGPAFNVLEGFEGPHDDERPPHRRGLEGRRPARGGRAEHGPAALARTDPGRSGRAGAQRFRRDRRGALPHLGLRLRVGRAGRGRVQGRGRALHLQPLRQPDGDHLRGADAPARGRGGVLRHGIRHVGRVHRDGRAVRRGRPGRVVAGAVRVVLRDPRRDPAALGGRDGLRRRHRPRPVAGGAVGARRRPCSSRRRATRCRSSSTSRPSASSPTRPGPPWSSTTSSAHRCSRTRSSFGADVVVYSATKHIDGQGRALGGAILGTAEFIEGPVKNLMRHTGPSLSPFNAWVMTKGLETLDLRVRRMAESCLIVARTLEEWQHVRAGHPAGGAPVPREPPPARARPAPDGRRWRHRRHLRGRGRQGRRRSR